MRQFYIFIVSFNIEDPRRCKGPRERVEGSGFSFKPATQLFLGLLPVQNLDTPCREISLGLPKLLSMPGRRSDVIIAKGKIAPEHLYNPHFLQ